MLTPAVQTSAGGAPAPADFLRLAMLLDSLEAPVGLYDLRGRGLHWNPGLKRVAAVEGEERFDSVLASLARELGRRGGTSRRRIGDLVVTASAAEPTHPGYRIALVQVARDRDPHTRMLETASSRRLTAREAEVARALAEGLRNDEIANSLGISRHTIRHHIEAVFRKLGVTRRAAVGPALRGG